MSARLNQSVPSRYTLCKPEPICLANYHEDIMHETISKLKERIAAVMPLLDANLAAAHQEYMDARLPAGAYGYCRTRHEAAAFVVASPADNLNEEAALLAGTRLFIDLRSAIKDVPADRRSVEEGKVEDLRKFFLDQGFTAINQFFNIPMRPVSTLAPA